MTPWRRARSRKQIMMSAGEEGGAHDAQELAEHDQARLMGLETTVRTVLFSISRLTMAVAMKAATRMPQRKTVPMPTSKRSLLSPVTSPGEAAVAHRVGGHRGVEVLEDPAQRTRPHDGLTSTMGWRRLSTKALRAMDRKCSSRRPTHGTPLPVCRGAGSGPASRADRVERAHGRLGLRYSFLRSRRPRVDTPPAGVENSPPTSPGVPHRESSPVERWSRSRVPAADLSVGAPDADRWEAGFRLARSARP
jgi:hypothetical protein